MISKELASQILYNFNLKQITVLEEYCDTRIRDLQVSLEQAQDIGDIRSLQGQIRELRSIKKMYEYANNIVDLERTKNAK